MDPEGLVLYQHRELRSNHSQGPNQGRCNQWRRQSYPCRQRRQDVAGNVPKGLMLSDVHPGELRAVVQPIARILHGCCESREADIHRV